MTTEADFLAAIHAEPEWHRCVTDLDLRSRLLQTKEIDGLMGRWT